MGQQRNFVLLPGVCLPMLQCVAVFESSYHTTCVSRWLYIDSNYHQVKLGLLPGWGGTQLLHPVVGLQAALDMILTGELSLSGFEHTRKDR